MTTPVEERALSLTFKLKEAQEFDDHGERVAQVAKFRDGVNGRCEVLDRAVRHHEELRSAGLTVPALACSNEVKEIRKRQRNLQRMLLDPEVGPLAIARVDASKLLEVGTSLGNKAKNAAARGWSDLRDELVPANAFQDLPAASAPETVRGPLEAAINDICVASDQNAWEDAGAVARLQAAVGAFLKAWTDFEPYISEMPPAVKEFVESVRAGQATLSQLTPEVLSWLQEKGEATRFEVRR